MNYDIMMRSRCCCRSRCCRQCR